jgi:murein L,D-transpeptidase YafK
MRVILKSANFISLLSFLFLSSQAKEFYPAPLLKLDKHFSHHVILAEKATHKLYLYGYEDGIPKLIKSYSMATGKKAGDKLFQGDHRTPEGIYFLTDFLTHEDLIKRHGKDGEIYGVGAFVLDYPNPIDKLAKKTGSGIWLHSTNDETRIEKGLDSRGCLVTANKELIDIAKYIELGKTPLIVVHNLKFITRESWNRQRNELERTFNNWINAWSEENFEQYISSYHEDFYDRNRGPLDQFKVYKQAVFNNPGKPEITADHVFIMQYDKYAMITFKQNYQSNTIKDHGRKVLYLKKDQYYNWKIISENWSKWGMEPTDEQSVAFRPSMRFFKTRIPSQILGNALLHAKEVDNDSQQGNN